MPATLQFWTADDLDRLPEDDGNKYEVVDGRLLVTPAPSLVHEVVRIPLSWIVDHRECVVHVVHVVHVVRAGGAPEAVTEALRWKPEGAVEAFELDVQSFFRSVVGERL